MTWDSASQNVIALNYLQWCEILLDQCLKISDCSPVSRNLKRSNNAEGMQGNHLAPCTYLWARNVLEGAHHIFHHLQQRIDLFSEQSGILYQRKRRSPNGVPMECHNVLIHCIMIDNHLFLVDILDKSFKLSLQTVSCGV